MKKELDKIVFESRCEIEAVIDALYKSKQNENEDVEKMIRLLEIMYMEW